MRHRDASTSSARVGLANWSRTQATPALGPQGSEQRRELAHRAVPPDVAVANGGQSIEEPPGLRDPDGNKLCAVYRVPKAG